jgi:adenine-specific DNA-methyltransferase
MNNVWIDVGGIMSRSDPKIYVVQTSTAAVMRCMLMTTDPGDLILDPTCGSGTSAFVAEQWGRRWITCDTSRVALTLAKQRLMAAVFDYYELAHVEEGVGSGFLYKEIPHVTIKSIANNPEIRQGMTREQIDAAISRYADRETLFDQPLVDKKRVRVTGPFTFEAVPAPTVKSLDEIDAPPVTADNSVARSGPTLRHAEWRDELLKTGLRGKGGHHIDFSRVEPLAGTRWLHADAETRGVKPERVVISFGPEHSLLDNNQVELAWQEARTLNPRPAIIVFAAFEFDPDAAKDIDELTKEKTGMTFLTAQMNADLLTEDLKKKRASNQSFWLVGRPDVDLRQITKGDHKGKWEVEVQGFDYYNTRTGTIESGDTSRIAMWLFDPDYDGRSLYPRQVFFPMADDNEGWARLAKNLKAEIDPELMEAYRGATSLPFEPGPHKRAAIKVIDDRGIESLKVVDLK